MASTQRKIIITHEGIAQAAAALSVAVAQEPEEVEGEEGHPDCAAGHQVVEAEFARVRDWKGKNIFNPQQLIML